MLVMVFSLPSHKKSHWRRNSVDVCLICPSNNNVLNGCIFGELATNDKLEKSKVKGATNFLMVEITSKCKTTKTTPGALDPKEDLVTMCKSKTHPSIRVCLQHLHAKLSSNQYLCTDSCAGSDNHELTSDHVG